ncbi:Protein UNUSUAL FLORAL ORGANS [Acorus gramineus]|uniref:Protein UNUSUAL FLORAL ORGANS n=1 Tax=Acorus gramineus TaxID=55184 RepID=A0AAV9BTL8_ACOGR|nr:Protein UNUSUAL FLORAL ORGANS [Acorus gramineus]
MDSLTNPTLPFSITTATTTNKRKTTTPPPPASSGPIMDTRIWSRIPHRLLDRILAFLPPWAFHRFRCVCKRFYSLLFSDSFLRLHLLLSPSLPCFLFFPTTARPTTPGPSNPRPITHAYLLDPSGTWHRVPLRVPMGLTPSAASNGIISWASDTAGPKLVLLHNPMSGLSAHLPLPQTHRLCPSVGLVASDSSLHVIIAGDDLISPFAVKNLTAETFSVTGYGPPPSWWAPTSPLPRLCSLDVAGRMVFHCGRYYCMSFSPYSVISYDPCLDAWIKIDPPMRRFLRSPCVVGCNGRLVLVAAVEKSKLNVPMSVRLWGLQSCGRNWVELERMPQVVHDDFVVAEGGRGFDCVGSGDRLAMVVRGGSMEVMVFDFERKEWRWAPPCPLKEEGMMGGGLSGFGYEPRLATPAIGLLDSGSVSFQEV